MTTTTDTAPLEQARQARVVQAALAAGIARDVARLWPTLDPQRLDATYPTWLRLMIALVNRYHALSSHAAGIYYRDARQLMVGTARDEVRTAPLPTQDLLTRGFGFSGPGVLTNDSYQPGSALSITQGTAQRIAANGGRDTVLGSVKADPKALGWYRVTDGHPCPFCALLASRGAVYKRDSFKESDARFVGPGTIKVHNDCGCIPGPLFDRSQPMPDVSQAADRLYKEHVSHLPNSQRLAAFRKVWDEHLAAQTA